MKSRIEQIEVEKNNQNLLKIHQEQNGRIQLENRPKKKSSGLYWLYTSYTMDELCNAGISPKLGAVDIHQLANTRKDLHHVIKPTLNHEFWVVYNGIGGHHPTDSKSSYDLGSRIIQEFADHQKTGSLKILGTTLNDLPKWRYVYVELDWEDYNINKKNYETGWRLEYGWPILSKQ